MMDVKFKNFIDTEADKNIRKCLDTKQSFAMIAGAGSGKTTSLILALQYLRNKEGARLRRIDQKVLCITYTNRAVEVISSRLDWDDLFRVSTLHAFLWDQIKRFTPNIRKALRQHLIPMHIAKKQEADNGGQSQRAIAAREKVKALQNDLASLDAVHGFHYNDTNYSNYTAGELNHDDVINVAAYLISETTNLREIIGQRFPYIFVDEAQDTFEIVVSALNKLCQNEGLPIVGYFGDPMQQIYDKRAGNFAGPSNSISITKQENFRCPRRVLDLLNAFRQDVQQFAAGANAEVEGSVLVRLVRAETPKGPRNRYTENQIQRASAKYDEALKHWELDGHEKVKILFLVRQMIARRLGFAELHSLFTGRYASTNAQERYESGEHFLLKPFVRTIYPLMQAYEAGKLSKVLDIIRKTSPAFDPKGINAKKTLGEMLEQSKILLSGLSKIWKEANLDVVLNYCRLNNLCYISDQLSEHLDREPRSEEYDRDLHSLDKGDWLVDAFLLMRTGEIGPFVDFITDSTPYSTQHGVKGEQYDEVVVVFDDTDAAWNQYSFTKMLTPQTSGDPTEGQETRSRNLAYVCFSRAEKNLRVLLFTTNPESAKEELIATGLFESGQVTIAD